MKKLTALFLALMMLASLAACAEAAEPAALVCAAEDLRGVYNPFFAESAGDRLVVDLTNGALLATARGGNVVRGGIAGETLIYDATEYDYTGLGDVEVARNADGSADYRLTLREDALFSDGHPVDIDDVIFSMYVLADADYDGPSGFAALPIEGMDAYRGGRKRLDELLLAAGRENADFSAWDAATQAAFWADIDAAGAQLCQEVVDYCLEAQLDAHAEVIGSTKEEVLADPALQLKFGMFIWGYAEYYFDGATTSDFWAAMLDAFEGDVRAAESTEKVSTPLAGFIPDYDAKYGAQVSTEGGAANISGVVRTGNHSLTIHTTEYDPATLYELALYIAPLHIYGDEALYDYENDAFGFTRGDLSAVRARQSTVGCGPYVLESGDAAGVTLRANANSFKGAPAVDALRIDGCGAGEAIDAVLRGEADLALGALDAATIAAINAANADEGLSGECVDTLLVDAPDYSYLGISAALVKVGDDAGSGASRALRRALMTVLAANRDEMVAQNLGDAAFVIEYPVNASGWAAPCPADEDYEICCSRDAEGAQIYADSMSDAQRHEAALKAAVAYLKLAGYAWDEASQRFSSASSGSSLEFDCAIAEGDLARSMVEAAAEQLAAIGIRLRVRELAEDELEAVLNANGAQMWIASRADGAEPDLYGRYHSDGAFAGRAGGNLCQIADPELDALIERCLSDTDDAARRASCKSALDLVLDWGCELPLYQGCMAVVSAADVVDSDTLPMDMTPDYGWWAEIENLRLR